MSIEPQQSPLGHADPTDFDSVESRLERHTLMAAIATRFIAVPTDDLDAAIGEVMSAIGRFAGLDRVALALFDEDGRKWSIDHDWHSEGLWSLAGLVEHLAPFRWGLEQILDGKTVEITGVGEMPAAAANDALLMRGLGVQSALLLPVRHRGRVIGFVSAASQRPRDTPWPRAFHELLQLPARIVVHALERQVAERRLRESQQRWDSLCNSNVVGVFSLRRGDTTVVDCNQAGLRLLARTEADLAAGGIAWRDFTPPEEIETDRRMRAVLERSGRVMPWQKNAMRGDGSRVPVLCSLASLGPDSDEMLSVAIDLSSRHRVAAELKRRDDIDRLHADLSRRLLDLSGRNLEDAVREALGRIADEFGFDGAVVFDVDEDANEAVRRSWWNRPAVAGIEPEGRIDLGHRAWWRERLRAGRTTCVRRMDDLPEIAVAEREAMKRFALQSLVSVPLLPGGTLRGFVLFYAARALEISDDMLAAMRVFGDIVANALERLRIDTEISEAVATLERRVETRRAQLEASNAELEAFAYSVSHDLRAPLRTIDGMCTVLREDWAGELGGEAVSLLQRIQGATRRMSHLIDGLLQLSRVVRTEMEWEPVSLSELAEDIVEEWTRANPDRRVTVHIAPALTTTGHPRLLRIALLELLENAFKFTGGRDDPRIDFDSGVHDGQAVFRLRDNGVGFDPDFARKLFGAFQRLHGTDEFEGHGIGLATVERVVRMHGGRAWAEGVPDHGATIYLALPGRAEDEP